MRDKVIAWTHLLRIGHGLTVMVAAWTAVDLLHRMSDLSLGSIDSMYRCD